MKLMKKLATLLLAVCLVVPCFSMMALAATPGKLMVGEGTAKAGEEVTVSLMAQVDAGIGKRTITITYDSSVLQFVSGSHTTKVSDGELKYESEEGINSLYRETELDKLTFKALQDGTAKVGVKSADIKSSFDITWTYYDGKVTVSGGTAVTPDTDADTDAETDADVSDEEADTDEPAAEIVADGADIVISSTTTITLIQDVTSVILPERFVETSVTMDGQEYAAWQDSERPEMYILYAASESNGASLYQYDSLENTYQRFEAPEVAEEVVVAEDNLFSALGDKANIVILGAGVILLLLFIIVIVLGVKLYNRNAELDEVYDDLDNALAEKDALKKAARTAAPVVAPVPARAAVETEDDVVLSTEETEENDDEVEVEFYVEEAIKDFFDEDVAESVVEEVEVPVTPAVKAEPVVETVADDFYDDDDDYSFSVDFIDLDD